MRVVSRWGRCIGVALGMSALGGCLAPPPAGMAPTPLIIDHTRVEVRCTGVVQRTNAPRMNDFGSAIPALMGSRGGKFDEAFVFLLDAWIPDIYDALLELGARPRATFGAGEPIIHHGTRLELIEEGYMNGDPIQVWVEWQTPEGTRRRAYEDFFIERAVVDGKTIEKPWTPHFVLHGSGVLNDTRTGCLACTHDCPGGLVANNALPLKRPIPVLKSNWDLLPKPGTQVIVVLRPVPSAPPRSLSK